MKTDNQGRGYVRVGKPTVAILSGEADLEQWDDEELLHGKQRDKLGRFSGRPPSVIPMACVNELNRRKLYETNSVIRDACLPAAEYMSKVILGTEEPKAGRLRACEIVLDRFAGKPTEKHIVDARVSVDSTDAPWIQTIRAAARTATGEKVIDTTATPVEPRPLCQCGCRQPTRPGSPFLNENHRAHAERKATQSLPAPPAPEPIDDDDFEEEAEDEGYLFVWPPG